MSWKQILNELSFRVSDGIPDLTNEQHLMKLYDVLKEHQWPVEARVELIKNLTESEEWWTKMSPTSEFCNFINSSSLGNLYGAVLIDVLESAFFFHNPFNFFFV